jgi:chromosome segregation ATPase
VDRTIVRNPIQKGDADRELQKIQTESCQAEQRIRKLKDLIQAAKTRDIVEDEQAVQIRREIERIEGEITEEKERKKSLRAEIARAKGDSESGKREDWTVAALRMVSSDSDDEKSGYLRVLLEENKMLKEEIARVDFMLYGRNGKYQFWRQRR